jgi:hypothetical protein
VTRANRAKIAAAPIASCASATKTIARCVLDTKRPFGKDAVGPLGLAGIDRPRRNEATMRFATFSCRTATFVVASVLAGCGGGGGVAVPAHAVQPADHQRGTVRFTIAIPKATGTASARRSPRYVSPATASMTVHVVTDPGGTSVVSETVALTNTSNGCSSTLASTSCTLAISLPIGSYDASISTADAGATALSQGQLVDFTIVEGQTNTVALTLSGIPTALIVSGAALAVHGSQAAGFTLYGLTARPLLVQALDADGNVIVGPGAPTFTVASTSGSGYTIVNPTTTAPNTVTLTPPGTNGASETFSVTAASGDGTCALSGSVCSATFSVKNDVQTLFVANHGNSTVMAYAPPYTGAGTTISNGVAVADALATDAAGDLFVGSFGAGVTEYASPYTGAPMVTIGSGVDEPVSLAFDAVGDLFVSNSAGGTGNAGTVTEYAAPYGGPSATISTGIDTPGSLALDGAGDVFVANLFNSTVTEYAPPYTGTPTTISTGVDHPEAVALNATGDLFVANAFNATVTEYAPPYSGTPTTISSGVSLPDGLTVNSAGDVFVSNEGNNKVTEYAPPYTGSPMTTIGANVNGPTALQLDGAGDLFVVNAGNNTVTEYAPPYTGSPIATISGFSSPDALALTR